MKKSYQEEIKMKSFSSGISGLLLIFGLVLGGCESLGEAFKSS